MNQELAGFSDKELHAELRARKRLMVVYSSEQHEPRLMTMIRNAGEVQTYRKNCRTVLARSIGQQLLNDGVMHIDDMYDAVSRISTTRLSVEVVVNVPNLR